MQYLSLLTPLLLAIYPVLHLFSVNIDKLLPSGLITPLCIAIGIGFGLSIISALLYQDFEKGCLLANLIFLLSIGIGPLFFRIENTLVGKYFLDEYRILWITLEWIALLGFAWKLRPWTYSRQSNRVLTVIAVVLILFPALELCIYLTIHSGFATISLPSISRHAHPHQTLPDIYYIILDGYGRKDVLQKQYHYDNSAFVNYLHRKGFYIADKSRSNYPYTFLSLASSLNMRYLDALNDSPDQEADGTQMILHNQVIRLLKAEGYTIIHLNSGWVVTGIDQPEADKNYSYKSLNEFSILIVKTSLLGLYYTDKAYAGTQRDVILYNLGKLRDIPPKTEPTFTFAHFVCPHPPFVFDRKGKLPKRDTRIRRLEADWLPAERYVDQLVYISSEIQKVIDHIIKQSDIPPIIIVQSDHGPACPGMVEHPSKDIIWQRTTILNAYYVSNRIKQHLYPSISPVNSFRVILNDLFDYKLPLLPDKNYYAGPIGVLPYTFQDVTNL